jgi:cytoskeleton protein RodZ
MAIRRRGAPAAAGSDRESAALVGRLLRDRRQIRGLTIEQVAVAIRVGAQQVLAVEEGRFAELPPQPYARGLVRAYALLLGLEPEDLLRACGPALAGEGGAASGSVFRYPAGEKFIWREWAVPFALAVAVAAIVVARAVLTPAPAELPVPAVGTAAVASPVQQAAPIADLPPQAAAPAPPAAVPAVRDLVAPGGQPAAAAGVRVLLRCEGATWVEAAPDGGEQRRYELGPGQNLEITAREKLSLSLGDAGVIRLSVNERELGFIGYKGETKTGLSFVAAKGAPAPVPAAANGD